MSSSSLYRIGGIVLMIGAVLDVVSSIVTPFIAPDFGPNMPVSTVTSPTYGLLAVIALVSVVLLLFGLVSLYIRQTKHSGVLGLLGFLLTFLGYLFTKIVTGFFFSSVLPTLPQKAHTHFRMPFRCLFFTG